MLEKDRTGYAMLRQILTVQANLAKGITCYFMLGLSRTG